MIGFASDFGTVDPYVGICHAVIARIAPGLRVIDLGHEIPAGDVRRGAALLAQAAPFLPAPPVLLAVVDPGVGTERAAVVLHTGSDALLVGPDNGLLVWAAEALGGVRSGYAIENRALLLEPLSATFHGRDVFAPVAARLASGLDPALVGPTVPVDRLVRLPDPVVTSSSGALSAEVLMADRYGNLQTAARLERLRTAIGQPAGAVSVRCGDRSMPAVLGRTYGDVPAGAAVVYQDSAGLLAIAINGGSVAEALSAGAGDTVVITASR
ncbi:MAG: SAM-dependent chlorinase/fluorinase [Sporichthyaceae bacterium]|nr:SAM-dependent chlorinase/fluorinase [Sporichthyaceae bacterium]